MGSERAVTRWYLQRQFYESEVTTLKAKIDKLQMNGQEAERKERVEFEEQLVHVRSKLQILGPCPKAMMG